MHIPLPTSLNSAATSAEAQRLRLVVPSFRFGPFDLPRPGAETVEVGAHRVMLLPGYDTVEARVGDVYMLFAMKDRGTELAVLVDTDAGPRQVLGYSRASLDLVRAQKFGRSIEPVPVESGTPAGMVALSDDDARAEADRIVNLADALKRPSEPTLLETDRLVAVVDDLDGKAFSEAETDETARLVQLASTLDDSDESGDAEVDRLVRLADGLSDG